MARFARTGVGGAPITYALFGQPVNSTTDPRRRRTPER
jgi:hypothetical protein